MDRLCKWPTTCIGHPFFACLEVALSFVQTWGLVISSVVERAFFFFACRGCGVFFWGVVFDRCYVNDVYCSQGLWFLLNLVLFAYQFSTFSTSPGHFYIRFYTKVRRTTIFTSINPSLFLALFVPLSVFLSLSAFPSLSLCLSVSLLFSLCLSLWLSLSSL